MEIVEIRAGPGCDGYKLHPRCTRKGLFHPVSGCFSTCVNAWLFNKLGYSRRIIPPLEGRVRCCVFDQSSWRKDSCTSGPS